MGVRTRGRTAARPRALHRRRVGGPRTSMMEESPVVEESTNAGQRARRRRPWISAVLTFFLSGLGQVYAGRARRGALIFILSLTARSEERRVGKECRSRWSPDP